MKRVEGKTGQQQQQVCYHECLLNQRIGMNVFVQVLAEAKRIGQPYSRGLGPKNPLQAHL